MNNAEYTALAGKIGSSNKLKVMSSNTANASTPGFKADDVLFQKRLYADANKENAMPVDAKTVINHKQGDLKQTGNKFDFAIMGAGFFAAIDGDGRMRFTRNGKFTLSAEGILKDMHGRSISDADGGEINIGENNSNFDVLKDSRIFVDGEEIGMIGVFQFPPDVVMKKGKFGDFIIEEEPEIADFSYTSLMQGMIETSNFDPIIGLLELTETSKQVENNNMMININRENIKSTYKIFSRFND